MRPVVRNRAGTWATAGWAAPGWAARLNAPKKKKTVECIIESTEAGKFLCLSSRAAEGCALAQHQPWPKTNCTIPRPRRPVRRRGPFPPETLLVMELPLHFSLGLATAVSRALPSNCPCSWKRWPRLATSSRWEWGWGYRTRGRVFVTFPKKKGDYDFVLVELVNGQRRPNADWNR